MTTLLARLTQRHLAFLGAHASPGNGPFERMREGLAGAWQHSGLAMPDAMQRAGAQIYAMAQRQARLLAYVDVIWIFVCITLVLVPIPFLMSRPKRAAAVQMGH
jgi:DHA2 family multidrug resistance protein